MKKTEKIIWNTILVLLALSVLGWSTMFFMWGRGWTEPLQYNTYVPHLRELSALKVSLFSGPFNTIATVLGLAVLVLYIRVNRVEESESKLWLCNFANFVHALLLLGYLYIMNFLTKTTTVLTIPVCIVLGIVIAFWIWNRTKYKKARMREEQAYIGARVDVIFGALVLFFTCFLNSEEIIYALDSRHEEKYMSSVEYDFESYCITHMTGETIAFPFQMHVAYINMFNECGEYFTIEELVDAYQAFQTGEGTWVRFLDYRDACNILYDEHEYYGDLAFARVEVVKKYARTLYDKADEMPEKNPGADFWRYCTMEEVEKLMLETYYEMEDEFIEAGIALQMQPK